MSNDLEIGTLTVQFIQDVDSNGNTCDVLNEIQIEITDAGGGPYVVIKTERFAIDEKDKGFDWMVSAAWAARQAAMEELGIFVACEECGGSGVLDVLGADGAKVGERADILGCGGHGWVIK